MNFEVGVGSRGRPKKTWSEVIEKDCHTRHMCKKDAMDRRNRIKLLKMLYISDKGKVSPASFFLILERVK